MLGVFARRHDRDRAHFPGRGTEFLRIAGHVGQALLRVLSRPGRRLGQALQQHQRGCQFMRLARHQDKVDEPAGGITDTGNLAAETAP